MIVLRIWFYSYRYSYRIYILILSFSEWLTYVFKYAIIIFNIQNYYQMNSYFYSGSKGRDMNKLLFINRYVSNLILFDMIAYVLRPGVVIKNVPRLILFSERYHNNNFFKRYVLYVICFMFYDFECYWNSYNTRF